MSTPAPDGEERVVSALGAARARLTVVARSAAREARPWLRPQNWTRENVRAALVNARQRPRQTALIVAGLVAAVGAAAYLLRDPIPPGVATALVEEAPFDISVVESGTLQALRSVTYASTIQSNQAKIIAMVPEGKLVQKGDLLILFDGSPFEEEIRRSQAQLQQAEADLDKARQDSKLQAIQNTEEQAAARQKELKGELDEMKDPSVWGTTRRIWKEYVLGHEMPAVKDTPQAPKELPDIKPMAPSAGAVPAELRGR